MRRLVVILLVLLTASLLRTSPAEASIRVDFTNALSLVGGSITVPPEWDGIWTTTDSTYDCTGGFLETSTDPDTICAGQAITESPEGIPFTVTCTGTADGTTIDVTCTGIGEVSTDCTATVTIDIDATRSDQSYTATTLTNVTFSGTAPGCDLIPDFCERIETSGTRTGPAPPAYCATTPVLPSSWGRIKILYR